MSEKELNVSRIVGLHTENVMRLKAVDLTPPEGLVIVGGDNDQGKSSLLLSIEMALAGADAFPEMPVRKGQKRAVCDLDLGDLKVHRTISSSGSTTLTVKAKDGTPLDTPQKILDALRGNRSFDPMEFMRLKEEKQAEVLRQIACLDTSALDADYKKAFDERTIVNREVSQKQAAFTQLGPRHPDVEEGETSAASIMAEQQKAIETNAENSKRRRSVEEMERNLVVYRKDIEFIKGQQIKREEEIAHLKRQIETIQKHQEGAATDIAAQETEFAKAEQKIAAARTALDELKDIPLGLFVEQLNGVEALNRKARHNAQHTKLGNDFVVAKEKSENLTRRLSAIETQKCDAIQAAKFPVPGLGFMDSGAVAYNGVPFSQASTSIQLKVSVAIGLALNPKLRILLIRNGNDLDDANMKLLAEMAREHKAQVWIERVQKTGDVAVIIEDGVAVPSKPEIKDTQQNLV